METVDVLIESFVKNNPPVKNDELYKTNSIFFPYFTREEKENLNGYYSDNTNEEYIELYENILRHYNDSGKSWYKKISELQFKLKNTNDPEEINQIKQDMISLGWNPEIEYNIENQYKAINRYNNIINEKSKFKIIDYDNFILEENNYIEESSKEQKLYPISIVTVQGNSPFSAIINQATKGIFSHAAISLDVNLNRLYSFNFDNKFKNGGGFSIENIKNYPKDNRLAIYTVFVTKNAYDKINENIQYMITNIKNTSYSLLTLITFPFKNISIVDSESMICSQFVDGLLKIANLDFTEMQSNKVSPNKLYFTLTKNPKAFKVFDGVVKDFNNKNAENKINKLLKTAIPANESTTISYTLDYVNEARRLPIGFNDDGDILLTNPFPNFTEEYFSSHKLLLNYEKTNNLEGMKYELARLYYMNYILEQKLYHNKNLPNKQENIKTRARILNDFNKYLKYVNSKDNNFNFSEYYESSPFYVHTVEIPKSSIGKIKNIISYIL